jgi:hypothetical protein
VGRTSLYPGALYARVKLGHPRRKMHNHVAGKQPWPKTRGLWARDAVNTAESLALPAPVRPAVLHLKFVKPLFPTTPRAHFSGADGHEASRDQPTSSRSCCVPTWRCTLARAAAVAPAAQSRGQPQKEKRTRPCSSLSGACRCGRLSTDGAPRPLPRGRGQPCRAAYSGAGRTCPGRGTSGGAPIGTGHAVRNRLPLGRPFLPLPNKHAKDAT